MANSFAFPIVTLDGPVEMVCTYDQSVEDFIDEVINLKYSYLEKGITPTHLALGYEQMKMLTAYTSYHLDRPSFPIDFEGTPVIVLNNRNYMDFLYDPQDATADYHLQSLK